MANFEPPFDNFMNAEVTIDFSDPATLHDRVLLIEGKKFHVHSNLLAQFCEFFNGLFNANFKEKNEEEIELKDIPADDFENFLRALYPLRLRITSDNLAGLMQLSYQFLCPTVWSLCLDFLKNKKEIGKLEPSDLLELSKESNSAEIKILVENHLIEKNKFFRCQTFDTLKYYFDLSVEYGLDNLKNVLQNLLTPSNSYGKLSLRQIMELCETYSLDKLKSRLERTLLMDLEENMSSTLFRQALKDIFLERMSFLRKQVKMELSDAVNGVYYNVLYDFLKCVFVRGTDIEITANMEMILIELFNETEDKKSVLDKYLETARAHKLNSFKAALIDYVEEVINQTNDPKDLVFYLEAAANFGLTDLQSKVESVIENMFIAENAVADNLSEYLQIMRKYKINNLKTMIENHLIETSEKVENDQLYDLLKLAEEFHFPELRTCLDNRMCSSQSLDDNYNLYYVLKSLELCSLPNLVVAVDKFFDQQLEKFDKTKKCMLFELMNEEWAKEMKSLVVESLVRKSEKYRQRDVYHQMALMYNLPSLLSDDDSYKYRPFVNFAIVGKGIDKQMNKKFRKQIAREAKQKNTDKTQ